MIIKHSFHLAPLPFPFLGFFKVPLLPTGLFSHSSNTATVRELVCSCTYLLVRMIRCNMAKQNVITAAASSIKQPASMRSGTVAAQQQQYSIRIRHVTLHVD